MTMREDRRDSLGKHGSLLFPWIVVYSTNARARRKSHHGVAARARRTGSTCDAAGEFPHVNDALTHVLPVVSTALSGAAAFFAAGAYGLMRADSRMWGPVISRADSEA